MNLYGLISPISHQSTHPLLPLEPFLCRDCDCLQLLQVIVPDAAVISSSGFVLEDEGREFVAEAFFEEEDAAQAAVVVGEGVDLLEGNMEAQELFQAVWRSLVDTQKVGEGFADVLWWESEFALLCAEAAGVQAAVEGGGGAGGQDAVVAFDEQHGQRLHDRVKHGPDAAEMVDRLHQIVYLHGFEGRADLARAIDLLHLLPGQPVAGHAS